MFSFVTQQDDEIFLRQSDTSLATHAAAAFL